MDRYQLSLQEGKESIFGTFRVTFSIIKGKQYYDMVGGIGGCNQGHCHPKIFKAFVNQASKLTLTSRAIHSDQLGLVQKKLHDLFGYDKSCFMNGGVEAA
jgi:ornithine--oxo-acid transaminase